MKRMLVFSCICMLSLVISFPVIAQERMIEIRQWATSAEASSQFGDEGWSSEQATGTPNTPACGDFGTAWASLNSTESATLTVMFGLAVVPWQVNIYATYNPGAITKIELLRSDGNGVIPIPDSRASSNLSCPGVLSIDMPQDVARVDGVIIYLDQSITQNWGEIDAVELVGGIRTGSAISLWADYAQAGTQREYENWNVAQATGAPNSQGCADAATAWASAATQGEDQLTVFFPHLVTPARLDIYQNFHPGSIVGVDLIKSDGSLLPIPDSADQNTACPGKMSLDISTTEIVMGAIIHLDQNNAEAVNEIDAVQITGILADDGLVRQWATHAEASSQFGEALWSAMQATGVPNTDKCGDFVTAWASATPNGKDTLTLTFEQVVIPTSIHIYQSYNPGAIKSIDLLPANGGKPIAVSMGQSASGAMCPGILVVNAPEDVPPVSGITLHLDQTMTASWNEIDAVRLVGKPVGTQ